MLDICYKTKFHLMLSIVISSPLVHCHCQVSWCSHCTSSRVVTKQVFTVIWCKWHLLNYWKFAYFLCGLSPPKRRIVRWQNFAYRRVSHRPCAGLLSGFMSIGVVVTKNDIFKKPACRPAILQQSVSWLARCCQGEPWAVANACAVNSVTINSTGCIPGRPVFHKIKL